MRAVSKLILIGILSFVAPWALHASERTMILVVQGNTETNREAVNFIRRSLGRDNLPFLVSVTLRPESVKPGQYEKVVVLNTGRDSGIDPALAAFVKGYPNSKDVFVVNLYQNSKPVPVQVVHASEGGLGVDGVTASSAWKAPWGQQQPILDMHDEWFSDLVAFLGQK